VTVVLLVLVSS